MEWISVKDRLPDLNENVIAGFWFYDSVFVEELAWRFLWGSCFMVEEKNLSQFPSGKRWVTLGLGCSHNQITHWMPLLQPPKD